MRGRFGSIAISANRFLDLNRDKDIYFSQAVCPPCGGVISRMIKLVSAERTSSTALSDGAILQRQLAVYYQALSLVKSKCVMELGCGEGVGTAILADTAEEIVAIDYSRKAIEAAGKVASSPKIRFEIQKVPPIRARDGAYDVVAMFQMIEHLDDPGDLLEEICRVLNDDGILLLSTVNKDESLTDNPFHPHEFSREELQVLLQDYFARVKFFGLYGDEKYSRYLEENKSRVGKVMKLDVFNITSRMPLGIRKILYSAANRMMRISLRFNNRELCDGITYENFFFKRDDTAGCLDFFVICVK